VNEASGNVARVAPRVLRLFGAYKRRLLLLSAAILLGSAVGVAAPLLTKQIFDGVFPARGQPDIPWLAFLVGLMLLLISLGGVLAVLQTYLASAIGQGVMHDLRDRLYRHLQWMSLRFFTNTRTGEIQSRIANDVGGVGDVIQKTALTIGGNFIFLLAAFTAMAVIAWQLALLSVVILPVFALISIRAGRVRRRIARETQETLAVMTSITQETMSVSGALHAKVFDRQSDGANVFGAQSRRLAELGIKEQMAGRVFLNLAQTFFLIAPALTYLAAAVAVRNGSAHFSPGTLVAFTALQIRLFSPIRDLLDTSMTMQASTALFERIFQYLDLPHEIQDSPGAQALEKSKIRGAVAFNQVFFRYTTPARMNGLEEERAWTLSNVSIEIAPGQLAALVGPSGAGKTTLSYLAARLYDVNRGSVTIDGVDVRDIRSSSLADAIGLVTQETHLFHASIRENLRYARPEASNEELEAAAQHAFIHDRILDLENGYDTVVGERGYRLSGGEKQRLAIARVILKDPRILILDEATSALDSSSERLVQAALRSVTATRTTIAIAHRLSTVVAADVIFLLDRGRVVESGTHDDLIARSASYAKLYHEQFRVSGRHAALSATELASTSSL